jgi:hypothetical protein
MHETPVETSQYGTFYLVLTAAAMSQDSASPQPVASNKKKENSSMQIPLAGKRRPAPVPHSALAAVLLATGLAAGAARADVSITPRFAYYFDNTSQRQTAVDLNTASAQALLNTINSLAGALGATFTTQPANSARRSSQLTFPQYGATVSFGLHGSDATQIALTALYGTARGNDTTIDQQFFQYRYLGVNVQDTLATTAQRQGRFSRLDVEATLQHRLNETFSLVGGLRGERTQSAFDRTIQSGLSTNFQNLVLLSAGGAPYFLTAPVPETAHDSVSTWVYSARFGAAAYAPVGDKHLFYVNGLLQLSRTPNATVMTYVKSSGATLTNTANGETTVGPDISVGYLYRASDRFGIELRYRATVYFTLSGDSKFSDSRVNHGLSLGFTSWLGGR